MKPFLAKYFPGVYIPKFGQYKPAYEGIIYNAGENQHECIQEEGHKPILPYRAPLQAATVIFTKRTEAVKRHAKRAR